MEEEEDDDDNNKRTNQQTLNIYLELQELRVKFQESEDGFE